MSLSSARLSTARFASILADLQSQFPIPTGLLPAEKVICASYQTKMAHAISDHEGTDVVGEITANAQVPLGIAVVIPSTATVGSPSSGATTATGTVV